MRDEDERSVWEPDEDRVILYTSLENLFCLNGGLSPRERKISIKNRR